MTDQQPTPQYNQPTGNTQPQQPIASTTPQPQQGFGQPMTQPQQPQYTNVNFYTQPQQQPNYQQPQQGFVQPVARKSKIAAGLLAIFLGCFGVHNFYLGFTGKAIAQLLITLLSFFVLAFIPAIWALIEGICILCSSTGSPWHQDAHHIELTD